MLELKIEFFGRVQGVRFRHFVREIANKSKIRGYVTNRLDGGVLVIAQGERKELEGFLSSVQKGSLLAKVEGVSYYWRKKLRSLILLRLLLIRDLY